MYGLCMCIVCAIQTKYLDLKSFIVIIAAMVTM